MIFFIDVSRFEQELQYATLSEAGLEIQMAYGRESSAPMICSGRPKFYEGGDKNLGATKVRRLDRCEICNAHRKFGRVPAM